MRTVFLVILIMCISSSIFAAETLNGGTTTEELASQSFSAPSSIKVAVLPLFDYASSIQHQHAGSASVFQHFEHQGFDMIPILVTFGVTKLDSKLEPGIAMRREDAVRIGNNVNADWVVYGEINEMRTYEKKSKWIGARKKVQASIRLCVADCKTGDIIYWRSCADSMGDSGLFERKTTKLIRVAAQAITKQILDPLFKMLPKHELKGSEPNDKTLLDFEKSTWPESDDN